MYEPSLARMIWELVHVYLRGCSTGVIFDATKDSFPSWQTKRVVVYEDDRAAEHTRPWEPSYVARAGQMLLNQAVSDYLIVHLLPEQYASLKARILDLDSRARIVRFPREE